MNEPPITPRPLPPEAAALLAEVEGKRGYLLAYHRMLAAAAPEVLATYDRFYESLTLQQRVLTAYEKETVWAALLAAVREVHGFIHMKRAVAAGLCEADMVRAVGIAAVTEAQLTMAFASASWSTWTLPAALEAHYLGLFAAAAGDLDLKLAHLAALVCHGARRHEAGMVIHLKAAFAAGMKPEEAAEGLSYMLIPCGGNTLIEAVSYWEKAAAAGLVPPPY